MLDWAQLMEKHQYEAFRFESYPQYIVDAEHVPLEAWKEHNVLLCHGNRAYWDVVRKKSEQHVRHVRIRVMDEPLQDYQKFEIGAGYWPLIAAGAEVMCLGRSEFSKHFSSDIHDFWLFDDKDALQMHYEANGAYVSMKYRNDEDYIKHCKQIKKDLLQLAMPMQDYLNKVFKL